MNNAGMVGALNRFIETVTACRGAEIFEADADALVAAARHGVSLLSRVQSPTATGGMRIFLP